MCKLKSAIILKNRIFIPEYDSHSKMLEELGITDNYINASKVFVRAELSPAYGDVFSDIDGWEFHVDQDITPEWFDKKDCAERMKKAVKEWAKTHIFIGQSNLEISHGENIYIKDCKNVSICGTTTVKNICGTTVVADICGTTTVNSIYDNTMVNCIYDNATVKNIHGTATVKYIYGNATVENIYSNVTVKDICGNATVKCIYGNTTVVNIHDNAMVRYACDNAIVKCICDSAIINNIYDNASVENACGNALVNNICNNATVKYVYENAMVISSPYIKWNNSASLVVSDNAIFKDCYAKTAFHAGKWKFIEVKYEN